MSFADHLLSYHLVFFPGGHDKGVRQVIDSSTVASALSSYFLIINKEKSNKPARSVVPRCLRTERSQAGGWEREERVTLCADGGGTSCILQRISYTTMPFSGDYYKTYGAGSKSGGGGEGEVERSEVVERERWAEAVSWFFYPMLLSLFFVYSRSS
jgi:hypothetical protein